MGGRRPGTHGRGANNEAQLAVKKSLPGGLFHPLPPRCRRPLHPLPRHARPGVAVDCGNTAVFCRSYQGMPSSKVVGFVSYVIEDVLALALDSRASRVSSLRDRRTTRCSVLLPLRLRGELTSLRCLGILIRYSFSCFYSQCQPSVPPWGDETI